MYSLFDQMPSIEPTNLRLLLAGIESAIRRQKIAPLLRSLELALVSPGNPGTSSATLFSCDSFCPPHLDAQLKLYNSLARLGFNRLNFLNLPISHYLTSQPELRILKLAAESQNFLEINQRLLLSQQAFNHHVSSSERLPSMESEIQQLSLCYRELVKILKVDEWQQTPIRQFPFHELALRDLSLTYKCTPDLALDPANEFNEHYTLANQLNIWLLCLLVCEPLIGSLCFCMSFYTASTVFIFFCRQTGRSVRYFGPPGIDPEKLGASKKNLMCILDSPVSTAQLTHPNVTVQLNSLSLDCLVFKHVRTIVRQRFKGIGSHTYSSGSDPSDVSLGNLKDWIQLRRRQGGRIISLFSSSPDELIGQQLSFKHEETDLFHLHPSVFTNQEHWMLTVIEFFRHVRQNDGLIIRFHPRLAADKRGLPESPYFQPLWQRISDAVGGAINIRLIHPSEATSSYWVGSESDLILNGWSTIGLEFAIQGKLVTNAFYKCPLGGGAIYPVHLDMEPLRSVCEYFQRITQLLCFSGDSLGMPCDVIKPDEAAIAFVVAFMAGLTDLDDEVLFRCQLTSPKLLTPGLLSLLISK